MPTDIEYAWAAGFLDGEGCFSAHTDIPSRACKDTQCIEEVDENDHERKTMSADQNLPTWEEIRESCNEIMRDSSRFAERGDAFGRLAEMIDAMATIMEVHDLALRALGELTRSVPTDHHALSEIMEQDAQPLRIRGGRATQGRDYPPSRPEHNYSCSRRYSSRYSRLHWVKRTASTDISSRRD